MRGDYCINLPLIHFILSNVVIATSNAGKRGESGSLTLRSGEATEGPSGSINIETGKASMGKLLPWTTKPGSGGTSI